MNIDFETMAVLEEESQNVSSIFFVNHVYTYEICMFITFSSFICNIIEEKNIFYLYKLPKILLIIVVKITSWFILFDTIS